MKRSLVISNPAYLSVRNEQLVIRTGSGDDVHEATRHLEDYGVLIIEHQQVTMTSAVLQILAQNNVTLVVCDKKHMPVSMSWPMDVHHTHGLRARQQLESSLPLRKNLWKQTIEDKILNQAQVLKLVGKNDIPLRTWAKEVLSGDSGMREGIASRYYFQKLYGDDWVRHAEGVSPNHWLNYGYTLLRAAMSRALTGAGLLPVMGIQHQNKYNSFPLADDIMEPYRPFVDIEVYGMWLRDKHSLDVTPADKHKLFGVLNADCEFRGNRWTLQSSMEQVAANLANCFAGNTRSIEYPRLWYADARET